jgi:4-diphosphocytidyl-2-C-methyl-D-erythritol kinase
VVKLSKKLYLSEERNVKLSINAYAKINLTLDVLAKRADGFHEVEMVMQSVALADTVSFESADELVLNCSHSSLPVNEENLVMRTAVYLQELFKVAKGARISLVKNIPLAAGLAGGSSDAAATLYGLNLLWDLRLTTAELVNIGQNLGSDIPFCVIGGTALAKGRGEKLTLLPKLPKFWLILVKPDLDVSTQEIYSLWGTLARKQVNKSPAMVAAIQTGHRNSIIANLNNHLEYITSQINPEVNTIKQKLLKLGAMKAVMSGSGPTVYGIMKGESEALLAKKVLSQYYRHVYVTHTL